MVFWLRTIDIYLYTCKLLCSITLLVTAHVHVVIFPYLPPGRSSPEWTAHSQQIGGPCAVPALVPEPIDGPVRQLAVNGHGQTGHGWCPPAPAILGN